MNLKAANINMPHPVMRTLHTVGYRYSEEIAAFVGALDFLSVLGKRGAEYEIVTDMGGMPLIIIKTSKDVVDLEDLLKFWFYERRQIVGAPDESSGDSEG